MGDSSSSSSSLTTEPLAVCGEVGMWIFPTEETKATISILWASLRYFSAIAPAATRPVVSTLWKGSAYCFSG